jgi:anti-anti-sigma factor
MELATYPDGEGYIVEVNGALTAQEPLSKLPQAVDRVMSEKTPPAVKVRVREVETIDLEGIAALVRSWKLVTNRGARFELMDGQPRVRRRLEETGLLHLLEQGAP